MAYSQQTTHYGLPLPTSGDKSTFLDTNDAFGRIDSDIYEAKTNATAAVQDIGQIQLDVSQLKASTLEIQTDISQLTSRQTITEDNVTNLMSDMTTAKADISKLQTDFSGLVKKITINNVTTWGDIRQFINELPDNTLAVSISFDTDNVSGYPFTLYANWHRAKTNPVLITGSSGGDFRISTTQVIAHSTSGDTDMTNSAITTAGIVWTATLAYIEV